MHLGSGGFLHNYISAYHYNYCYAATFTEVPSSQVVGVGQEAVFSCLDPTAFTYGWIWNRSEVRAPDPPSGIKLNNNILTIVAQSNYNETEVVCVAFFNSGEPMRTTPVRLLIQGTESAPIDI